MSGLSNTIYNLVFKRTSTFLLASVGAAFFFERTFDLGSDYLFDSINQGKLYKDIANKQE